MKYFSLGFAVLLTRSIDSRRRTLRHRLGTLPGFAVGLAAAAFLLSGVGLAKADTVIVDVKSNVFSPKEVTVKAGDTVRWTFDQGVHTTTSSDGLWDSGVLGVGNTFEHTFNDLGDFAYVCTLHVNCCGMQGIVHVASPTPTPATLTITASPTAIAGTPFDVTVAAVDSTGAVVGGYTGTVTFTSSDAFPGVLPADYTFTAADQGTHTFSAGATFFTAGSQTLTAQDTATGSIVGSATVAVTAAPAKLLQVTAPAGAISGTSFDVAVMALDPYGNVDMSYAGTVTWASSDTDAAVMVPTDYPFQATDSGVHLFAAGVTLITIGDQTLTVTDTVSGITGSATVTVGPGP
jgi:plastocyanin